MNDYRHICLKLNLSLKKLSFLGANLRINHDNPTNGVVYTLQMG
jgi:hypothetical protein